MKKHDNFSVTILIALTTTLSNGTFRATTLWARTQSYTIRSIIDKFITPGVRGEVNIVRQRQKQQLMGRTTRTQLLSEKFISRFE